MNHNISSNTSFSPLHMAAMSGNEEKIRVMLQGVSPDKKWRLAGQQNIYGDTSLHLVARYGNSEAVVEILRGLSEERCQELLEKTNSQGYTPIHLAVFHGHDFVIVRMLDSMSEARQKMLLTKETKLGTPARLAEHIGHHHTVELLTLYGADITPHHSNASGEIQNLMQRPHVSTAWVQHVVSTAAAHQQTTR